MNILKKAIAVVLLLVIALSLGSCANSTTNNSTNNSTNSAQKSADITILELNKPLFTDIFYADPSAHVFNEKLYIYPSHDIDSGIMPNNDGDQYAMEDYHVLTISDFSSACIDNGQALHLKDIPWAKRQLWAPDAAYKNKKYYLYFPARDKEDIFRIGVATSASPTGPFKPENTYIEGSFSIDPAVFTDSDNKSYMYFGGLWGG